MLKLVISGTLPNLNDFINAERTDKHLGAAMKRREEQRVILFLYSKSQLSCVGLARAVVMHYTWFEPNRRRDKDNISSFGRKVIQDALVKAGVLKNDGWNEIEGFSDEFHVDKKNPRVEVEIVELDKEHMELRGTAIRGRKAKDNGPDRAGTEVPRMHTT